MVSKVDNTTIFCECTRPAAKIKRWTQNEEIKNDIHLETTESGACTPPILFCQAWIWNDYSVQSIYYFGHFPFYITLVLAYIPILYCIYIHIVLSGDKTAHLYVLMFYANIAEGREIQEIPSSVVIHIYTW